MGIPDGRGSADTTVVDGAVLGTAATRGAAVEGRAGMEAAVLVAAAVLGRARAGAGRGQAALAAAGRDTDSTRETTGFLALSTFAAMADAAEGMAERWVGSVFLVWR